MTDDQEYMTTAEAVAFMTACWADVQDVQEEIQNRRAQVRELDAEQQAALVVLWRTWAGTWDEALETARILGSVEE